MRDRIPTPAEQIRNPIKEDAVEFPRLGPGQPLGHTGELRKTKEENKALKARGAELEAEVDAAVHGHIGECLIESRNALRIECDRYREALEQIRADCHLSGENHYNHRIDDALKG